VSARRRPWWRDAVVYQVYIRSFADGSGDGIGDIAGLHAHLPYLRDLGIDAIWINPWYRSPMADGGYDVADYRDIDPLFGTLADAEALILASHEHGIRVLVDLVPNHTSDRHPWFVAALAAPPGSPERARYWFAPGRGDRGELPPNDWQSRFGGGAWTRVPDGEWYLHLFAPEQPDLNWSNAAVAAEFEAILRFWLDRDVDGFRIDVAHGLAKDAALPDLGERAGSSSSVIDTTDHPHWDRDELQAIYRRWRAIGEEYEGDRTFVAEAWVGGADRLARYVAAGGLNTAFNFDFLTCPWDAGELRAVIDRTLATLGAVGAPSTWVLSNHDVVRHVTRYAGSPPDLALGTRRARAAALLMLALPGGAYVYQGEELGLWEVEDIPAELMQDPSFRRSGRSRDGCRVPLPWSGESPPFGFSPEDATAPPWLPQPRAWRELTAARETGDPDSMLALYRQALQVRRAHPALGDGELEWDGSAAEGVLSFTRSPGFRCVVNLGRAPVALPPGELIMASTRLAAGGLLPADAAAWLDAS
jgi:alpha-glucosidase